MFDCDVVREQMPLLLTESLPAAERERAHMHIEQCALCSAEWSSSRKTWQLLDTLPELPVPTRVRASFLVEAEKMNPRKDSLPSDGKVVPFRSRFVARRFAEAAAVLAMVGGSFFAGRQLSHPTVTPGTESGANIAAQRFNIAESAVVPVANVNPEIQGRPDIENVKFFQNDQRANEIGVSFDVTQHVTVTGAPDDRNMTKLVSYFLQERDGTLASRSNAVQWVRDQYGSKGSADPEIVKALANLLKNDSQEGVRIKAVDALRSLPSPVAPEVRNALVEALKNDPNPAVRIKAVDALATMAHQTDNTLDASAVDTLRQKAQQNDENPYVRVKAAEALSSMKL